MSGIYNKLEIDVMQTNELLEAAQVTAKYSLPAMVVHPSLATDAIVARGKLQGKFKIIIPVDWPKGETFGITKFRGLLADAFEGDGFEFMLSPCKTEIDTRNEAKVLTEFVHNHLPLFEVRFVMGSSNRSNENLIDLCNGLRTLRTPNYIRNDINTKTQMGKANPDMHSVFAEQVRSIIHAPLKISGNINNLKAAASCKHATRFGVNLNQARAIIKEFQQQPNQLKALLDMPPVTPQPNA